MEMFIDKFIIFKNYYLFQSFSRNRHLNYLKQFLFLFIRPVLFVTKYKVPKSNVGASKKSERLREINGEESIH